QIRPRKPENCPTSRALPALGGRNGLLFHRQLRPETAVECRHSGHKAGPVRRRQAGQLQAPSRTNLLARRQMQPIGGVVNTSRNGQSTDSVDRLSTPTQYDLSYGRTDVRTDVDVSHLRDNPRLSERAPAHNGKWMSMESEQIAAARQRARQLAANPQEDQE